MLRKKPRGNLSAKWQKIVFLFNDDTIHLWDAINPTAATYGVFVLSVVSLGGPSNSTTESRLIEEILPKELSSGGDVVLKKKHYFFLFVLLNIYRIVPFPGCRDCYVRVGSEITLKKKNTCSNCSWVSLWASFWDFTLCLLLKKLEKITNQWDTKTPLHWLPRRSLPGLRQKVSLPL